MQTVRYNSVAVALHWAIAILLLAQIAGGFYMHNLPNSAPMKFDLYQLHKSFGLSVFVLALARLGWRLTHKPPGLPEDMPGWQKLAARATHWIFYFLMLATPLVGLAIVSVSPKDIPTEFLGLIPVPHLTFLNPGADPAATEHNFIELHEFLSFAILGLLALHVAAALKHGFYNHDGVLRSMAPGSGALIGVGLIFLGLGAGALVYFAGGYASATARNDVQVTTEMAAATPMPEPAQVNADQSPSDAAPVVAEPEQKTQVPASAAVEAIHGPCGAGIAVNWTVDNSNSALRFIGEQNGRSFEGDFADFDVEIAFDEDNLAQSWLMVIVQTASASTGDQLIDSTMPGGEWFDVKDHPVATFKSCDIRQTGESAFAAHGALTIKTIEQDLILPFSLNIAGERASAAGGVDLLRTEFDLGAAATWLDDEGVALKARVEFVVEAGQLN